MDFQQLKTDHSITDVLAMLGITHLTTTGEVMRGTCPLCQHSDPRAFVVTPEKNTFYCWREKKGGDQIRLVALFGRIKDVEAANRIAQHFGAIKADANASAASGQATSRKAPDFDTLKYLATLDAEHEALKGLDILPETFAHFKAGFCSKGLNRGRLAVAWHNVEGVIHSFIGVALDGSLPLYLMPKGLPLPYFFGTNTLEEDGELHILPTILDVMRAWEAGMQNVICPLAPTTSDALVCLQSLCATKKLTIEW